MERDRHVPHNFIGFFGETAVSGSRVGVSAIREEIRFHLEESCANHGSKGYFLVVPLCFDD